MYCRMAVCFMFLLVQAPVRPVFVAEAKATDPVLGGGSLRVRSEGLASATSVTADAHSSLPQNTQRARATGVTTHTTACECESVTDHASVCHSDRNLYVILKKFIHTAWCIIFPIYTLKINTSTIIINVCLKFSISQNNMVNAC